MCNTNASSYCPSLPGWVRRCDVKGALDFGSQMSLSARVASEHPEVGQTERERFRVVLLDEYQDTGHAQRVLLSSLFGGGADGRLALTAVGDPMQSIYGWRGASAANLPRFATDFPLANGKPAPTLELLTSWRNPPEALELANPVVGTVAPTRCGRQHTSCAAGSRRRRRSTGAARRRRTGTSVGCGEDRRRIRGGSCRRPPDAHGSGVDPPQRRCCPAGRGFAVQRSAGRSGRTRVGSCTHPRWRT